ncbi:hypothetical protein VD0002_g461 [Verticillium dahliae]|nr:hypothetical protein VD0002_g461 [Verticillium dahliae]
MLMFMDHGGRVSPPPSQCTPYAVQPPVAPLYPPPPPVCPRLPTTVNDAASPFQLSHGSYP